MFEASRATLRTVPALAETTIGAILSHHAIASADESLAQLSALDASPGWLLAQGHVDLPTMRRLDHYLTEGGGVFGCQILGRVGNRGPVSRLEILIDATSQPPRLLECKDLSEFGIGYPQFWTSSRDQSRVSDGIVLS